MSFVASRAVPSGGFWVALAGGVATARAGERHGLREGFGASVAAMVESVALMGPARLGVPLTQAASAPLLGRMHGRRAPFWRQYATCIAIRLAQNSLSTAFVIWVIVGGLDAYAGSYDALLGRLPLLPTGEAAALAGTALGLMGWALFAS